MFLHPHTKGLDSFLVRQTKVELQHQKRSSMLCIGIIFIVADIFCDFLIRQQGQKMSYFDLATLSPSRLEGSIITGQIWGQKAWGLGCCPPFKSYSDGESSWVRFSQVRIEQLFQLITVATKVLLSPKLTCKKLPSETIWRLPIAKLKCSQIGLLSFLRLY